MSKNVIIRKLEPEDAPALAALIRRCCGETYGPSVFYDTPALAKMIAKRKLCVGFFFCALLPEFAHTDIHRLQAITSLAPDDLELNLINKDAIRLGDFICQSAC